MVNKMKIFLALLMICSFSHAQVYKFFDGKKEVKIKLRPDLEAKPGRASDNRGGRSGSTPAAIRSNGILHIVPKQTSSGTRTATSGSGSTNNSNVVFEGDGGQLMAVPGGLIVKFKNGVSQASINNFISAHSLVLKEKIQQKNQTLYSFESPMGMETINLVNTLQQSSIVDSSVPDLWRDVRSRTIPKIRPGRKLNPVR
jgi:hypothetical protein